jgi:hypothetical protein
MRDGFESEIRVHKPKTLPDENGGGGSSPLVVLLYGGGFFMGKLTSTIISLVPFESKKYI